MMKNATDAELTAGLYCVDSAGGRGHFTSDRVVALDDADTIRNHMRDARAPGVQNVRAQYRDDVGGWHDCRLGR